MKMMIMMMTLQTCRRKYLNILRRRLIQSSTCNDGLLEELLTQDRVPRDRVEFNTSAFESVEKKWCHNEELEVRTLPENNKQNTA